MWSGFDDNVYDDDISFLPLQKHFSAKKLSAHWKKVSKLYQKPLSSQNDSTL